MKDAKKELKELQDARDAVEARIAALYKESVKAPADQKICEDWMADMLSDAPTRVKYPIQVSGIAFSDCDVVDHSRKSVGKFVAVRPCDKKYENKTYLGVYIGDVALRAATIFNPDTGVLSVGPSMHNPAMWVPNLNRLVFGAESWWGVLNKPEDLQQISDADIDNVWYVQALKGLSKKPEEPAENVKA